MKEINSDQWPDFEIKNAPNLLLFRAPPQTPLMKLTKLAGRAPFIPYAIGVSMLSCTTFEMLGAPAYCHLNYTVVGVYTGCSDVIMPPCCMDI